MKVLVVHNRYQWLGGEDVAVDAEIALLREAGLLAGVCIVTNDAIVGLPAKIGAAAGAAHARAGIRIVEQAVAAHAPDIVHVHNFFPRISPAVHAAVRRLGVATVQTLHNFRPICAGALLLRAGAPCERCVDGSPYWGAWHACYRGSVLGSLATARMIAVHQSAGTWRESVDRFVMMSRFARDRFAAAGFPADKMIVKRNSVDDPGMRPAQERRGIVYAGRLSPEKGIPVLVEAARRTRAEIDVFGDGPLAAQTAAAAPANLRVHGPLPRAELRRRIGAAAALVLPSVWYEGCPMVIAEALAAGTPVVVSRIGALPELIADGEAGLLAPPGDAAALAVQLDRIVSDPAMASAMGRRARSLYEAEWTPEANLESLKTVYRGALATRRREPVSYRSAV